jgi:hypothetical protein
MIRCGSSSSMAATVGCRAMEACLDPHKNEWFNVYGNEDRKPGEWGHWTGRGMVWNQMCATCHNTRLRKNYDAATDSYHTTMAEMTVSCEACHGPMKPHNEWQQANRGVKGDPTLVKWSRDQHIENCAGCHARRGEITGDFVPGESFWDHYHLTITDQSDTFYPRRPDSRRELRVQQLLQQPHAPRRRALHGLPRHAQHEDHPARQPALHALPHAGRLPQRAGHHAGGAQLPRRASTGNQCVNCHMPQTCTCSVTRATTTASPFPIRCSRSSSTCRTPATNATRTKPPTGRWKPRRSGGDRKWTAKPAHACHAHRQSTPRRRRARDGLVDLLGSDEIPHWKASATLLLDRWIGEPAVQTAVSAQLQHAHPLVRQSAIRTLEPMLQNGSIRSHYRAAAQ